MEDCIWSNPRCVDVAMFSRPGGSLGSRQVNEVFRSTKLVVMVSATLLMPSSRFFTAGSTLVIS